MRHGYAVGAIIASALLFWALAEHAHGYYILLQWIVCSVSVLGVFIFIGRGQSGWVVALAVIAIVFNPIIQVRLSRATWAPIEVVAGLVLLASVVAMRKGSPPPAGRRGERVGTGQR